MLAMCTYLIHNLKDSKPSSTKRRHSQDDSSSESEGVKRMKKKSPEVAVSC